MLLYPWILVSVPKTLGVMMASYEKTEQVEEALAIEFYKYIIGTAIISDELHGYAVVLYRIPEQAIFAVPSIRDGVKVVLKVTEARRYIP